MSMNPSHSLDEKSAGSHAASHYHVYLGGTTHLVPWALLVFAVVTTWLLFAYYGGPGNVSSTGQFWGLAAFLVLLPIVTAISWEWSLRDTPGWLKVDDEGLHCRLPWRRQRLLRWDAISEVRCTARRFTRKYSFWEVRGQSTHERVTFSWQLPGYKELLRDIGDRAQKCRRFDEVD